jgi:hypothetical protein
VRRGACRPLARPLFVYVHTKRLGRPEVKAFIDFYTRQSESLATNSGTIPLNSLLVLLVQQCVTGKIEGSVFQRPDAETRSLEQLLTPWDRARPAGTERGKMVEPAWIRAPAGP